MRIIILGANKYAFGIAKKANMSKAKSIFIFERDHSLLMDLKEEIDQDHVNFGNKIKYSTELDINNLKNYIVFDCLSDYEEDTSLIKQIIKDVSLNAAIFFTTSKVNSVNYIASLTEDPKRVLGLQFISSFERLKIVELIKGIPTSQKILADAQNILNEMGKEAIIVKDSPGFMLNRLVFTLVNEAIHLLNEGIGTPKNIDDEMELGMGMKIGPLKLADQIGLDHTLKILNHLYDETGNNKYLPCPLLKNMVNAGYLGVSSNAGFFNYSAEILDFPTFNT